MACLRLILLAVISASYLSLAASQDIEKMKLEGVPNYQEILQTSQKAFQNLWKSNLQEGLKSGLPLSPECNQSIGYVLSNSSRLVPLLDALGKPGAGILGGNVNLPVAFDECFAYNYTAFCYSSAVIVLKLLPYAVIPWKVGMCVPKYCTSADIAGLINSTRELIVVNTSITCTNSKTPPYSNGAKIMIAVSCLFMALVLIGSCVDTLLQFRTKYQKVTAMSVNVDSPDEATPILPKGEPKQKTVNPLDFILAFSLFKTVPTLLATQQGPGVITCLNGIRVISMTWVILGHAYAFAMVLTSVDNPIATLKVPSRFSFQAVGNAYFSVDSFFFLSGVLVAFLTLKEMKKKKGRFPFLHYYVHRYLRITPTYAFVLFFATYLGIHLAAGPFMSLADAIGPACRKYWWTNLFYINNLYPWKLGDQCLGWGWYLANDMQFYIIAPTMLIAAYYLLPVAIIIALAFVLSGFTVDGFLTGYFDFQGNELSSIAYKYVGRPNITQAYTDAIYGKPWDRISPYIVGLALGYVLYKNIKFDYNKVLNLVFHGFLWAVATFTAFWLVYGLYFTWHGHIPSKAENVIYIMLSRCLWACCLALLVYVCHHGYGWVVNSFLSMKLWTPLARMTFNAYLIHPVVIFTIYGQLQLPIHYTDITLACYFIALVALSYAAAGIICVAVEFPLGSVEMLFFKLVGLNRRASQRHDTIATKPEEP